VTEFGGACSVEIDASPTSCFAVVCDTERTPEWHEVVADAEILERDSRGRASLVRTTLDARIARVHVNLRFSYHEPHRIHIERESGDLRTMTATWLFEALGDGRTLASYETVFDPGRALSLLARGPVVARLEELVAQQPPHGLKQALSPASDG
jgi:ribosome-associated toxin RatA of RatAB toxin-antitoxin module